MLERSLRLAAGEALAIELTPARHLDLEGLGQGVDHRHADPVQAARGLVDLGIELTPRMEGGHDHLERGLLRELWMRIDGDAPAVVGDGDGAVGMQLDLDEGGVPGHRLVHRVVDHLGEQVMEAVALGAGGADIHARPLADRLEPL